MGRAEAAVEIEKRTDELRQSTAAAATPEQVRALAAAIERGERASAGLRNQIQVLEQQTRKREDEKRSLERVQVVLTSGLVGALVTALVAILGMFLNVARGRAERDLKRLEVLEKCAQLESRGIQIPVEIRTHYSTLSSPR